MRREHRVLALCFATLMWTAGCNDSPTAPTVAVAPPPTSPQTVTFPGAIGAGGSVSRTFTPGMPGTARARISGITPATDLSIGLGIPRADGSGCLLTLSTTATNGSSAEVSTAVYIGTFCTQVLAPSGASDSVAFVLTIEYP